MDQELSRQSFKEQLNLLNSLVETKKDNGWIFEVVHPYFFCKIYPKNHPHKLFEVRLDFSEYPERAPSLQFVDPVTREEGKEFWPQQGNAFNAALSRKPEPQLCIEGVREFHEKLHASVADQKKYPWDPRKLTLPKILLDVQQLLDEAYP